MTILTCHLPCEPLHAVTSIFFLTAIFRAGMASSVLQTEKLRLREFKPFAHGP